MDIASPAMPRQATGGSIGLAALNPFIASPTQVGTYTFLSFEYQMTSSSQGNGECVMSDGARYKAHIGG